MQTTIERKSKTPLYQQISGRLREQIASGEYKPGERLQTYKEMSSRFGVSSITVIQAVDSLVQEGLVVRTQGSGIYVAEAQRPEAGGAAAPIARNGAPNRILNIGLHALEYEGKNWTSFYHEPMRMAVLDAVSKAGGRVIHEPITEDFLETALEYGADGILLGSLDVTKRHLLEKLKDAHIPYVIVGAAFDDRSMPCVAVDNASGIEAAVQHLISQGHRDIGFICMMLDNPDHQYRWKAFQHAAARHGLTVDPRLLLFNISSTELDDEKAQIREWMSAGLPPFTALIACSYTEAMAAMHILSERGLRIPDDISLVAFDDPNAAALLIPPLTTVRQPLMEMANRAVERLTDGIRSGRMPSGTEVVAPSLIVRESTRLVTG